MHPGVPAVTREHGHGVLADAAQGPQIHETASPVPRGCRGRFARPERPRLLMSLASSRREEASYAAVPAALVHTTN